MRKNSPEFQQAINEQAAIEQDLEAREHLFMAAAIRGDKASMEKERETMHALLDAKLDHGWSALVKIRGIKH
jgi:hypothetical protein